MDVWAISPFFQLKQRKLTMTNDNNFMTPEEIEEMALENFTLGELVREQESQIIALNEQLTNLGIKNQKAVSLMEEILLVKERHGAGIASALNVCESLAKQAIKRLKSK